MNKKNNTPKSNSEIKTVTVDDLKHITGGNGIASVKVEDSEGNKGEAGDDDVIAE